MNEIKVQIVRNTYRNITWSGGSSSMIKITAAKNAVFLLKIKPKFLSIKTDLYCTIV